MFVDNRFEARRKLITRRWFFKECGVGLGSMALGSLLSQGKLSAAIDSGGQNPMMARQPQFQGKAKSVIFLFMAGAPSHLEMFDYKPQLAK